MKPSTKRHLYVAGLLAKDTTAWAVAFAALHVPGYLIYASIVYVTDDTPATGWYFWTVLFSVVFWVAGSAVVSIGSAFAKDLELFEKTRESLKSRYDRASERFPDVAPEPGDLEVADDAQTMKGGLGR